MSDLQTYRDELQGIDDAIAAGSYKPGRWQKLIKELQTLPKSDRAALAGEVTLVSNHLHQRNGYPQLPVIYGFVMEAALLTLAVYLLSDANVWLRLAGVVSLGLCLQPILKISTAALFGVRYSYVFLWYFEPRFKMQFGTYMQRSEGQKMFINFMGSLGTPLALTVGYLQLQAIEWLSLICLVGALGAAGMQVGAFVAALAGVRKVGPFLLTNLTTPANLGNQLRERWFA